MAGLSSCAAPSLPPLVWGLPHPPSKLAAAIPAVPAAAPTRKVRRVRPVWLEAIPQAALSDVPLPREALLLLSIGLRCVDFTMPSLSAATRRRSCRRTHFPLWLLVPGCVWAWGAPLPTLAAYRRMQARWWLVVAEMVGRRWQDLGISLVGKFWSGTFQHCHAVAGAASEMRPWCAV